MDDFHIVLGMDVLDWTQSLLGMDVQIEHKNFMPLARGVSSK